MTTEPAASPPFLSGAHNHEDVVLFRALGVHQHGRYLDVGAGDPTVNSISRAFYDRGWRGITVDQVPEYVDRQSMERPEDRAVLARVGAGPDRRLDGVLAAAGWPAGTEIHFMTLDVDGTEAEALHGLDLQSWRPWVLVIAATAPTLQSYRAWEPLVTGAGYRFCLFDGLNRFYVAAEHFDDLGPALSYPACALDGFLTGPGQRTERALRMATDKRDRLRAGLTDRSAELAAAGGPTGPLAPLIAEIEAQETAALSDAGQWRARAVRDYPAGSNRSVGLTPSDEEAERLRHRIAHLKHQMDQMHRTVSWRATAPLRAVRRLRPGSE